MLLVIDNYDSFVYNLVQYFGAWEPNIRVFRNDQITVEEMERLRPERLLISPGPGNPRSAGISLEAIRFFSGKLPVLGVCLGHQAIGEAFGGKVVRAGRMMHGKTSLIHHDGKTIFRGLPNPFEAVRYHSLLVQRDSVPQELEISAWTDEGEIMGLRHRSHCVEGIQFHPESILTAAGKKLLENFMSLKEPR